jgi:hypothetical protein
VSALGLVEQVRKVGLLIEEQFHPFVSLLDAGGVACVELPCLKERVD